ncbi:uracil phosphoribosyltransferase, partial [Weissella cibaria]|nr:uracil phosphoribosyltransferase [Weissella cibaria]
MGKFEVLDHPLIQHKLTLIRDKHCSTKEFREIVNEISTLMAYEVSRDMPLMDVEIETP